MRRGSTAGSIPGVTDDVGSIVAPNGRLIVAVYREHVADQHVPERVIGDITRAGLADTGAAGPLDTS